MLTGSIDFIGILIALSNFIMMPITPIVFAVGLVVMLVNFEKVNLGGLLIYSGIWFILAWGAFFVQNYLV